MASLSKPLDFTLADLERTAQVILAEKPDGVVAYRLLHDVFHLPPGDLELERARVAALNSKWVQQLEAAQLPDGSFGRFHTQDTKVKTVFRTTEEAIDRSVSLGLDTGAGVLKQVQAYIIEVLKGKIAISDWLENNDSFPVLIKFILTGRLAQLDPCNNLLGLFWVYLEEVAERAFASGQHSLNDEVAAYLDLSGMHAKRGFLHSQHALWILSARSLPAWLDATLVSWVLEKPGGIGYIGVPLANPEPRQVWYWLRGMNILARFDSWREMAAPCINWLWNQRNQSGLWDFGADPARSIDYPLSDSWRKPGARQQDYSTSILALLRKALD